MGLSEEEAFIHIRRNNWGHVTEEKLRQIVGTAYDTHSKVFADLWQLVNAQPSQIFRVFYTI